MMNTDFLDWTTIIGSIATGVVTPKDAWDWTAIWTAVGSTATGFAAIIALIAYISDRNAKERAMNQAKANEIRTILRGMSQQSEILYKMLSSGVPLILGASEIVSEYVSRLNPNANEQEFWRDVEDEPLMLSVCLVGWSRSPQTDKLQECVDRMDSTVVVLHGLLRVLEMPMQMLDSIVNDGYSPLIFFRMFRDTKGLLRKGVETETSIRVLINHLCSRMQSDASLHFVARYSTAIEQLNGLIQLLCLAMVDLDDRQLLALSGRPLKGMADITTRTGAMKVALERLGDFMPADAIDKANVLVNEIEVSVSKETAAKKLGNLHVKAG